MGLPFVLDVAIGLIFIYLILSLLASEFQELLTTLFQWRAKHLKEAIEIFLAGGSGTPEEDKVKDLVGKLYADPLLKNINQESKSLVARGARVITRQLIPGNKKGAFGTNQSTGPSYIAPETFATSLLERLGLATLAKKLVEVRLEKFATRIVGDFKLKDGGLPSTEPKNSELPSTDPTTDPTTDPNSAPNDELASPASETDEVAPTEPKTSTNWDKGRIRLLAEKTKKDLSNDSNFSSLIEAYSEIVGDFKTGESTLETCVERMGESLEAYIESNSAPTVSNGNAVSTPAQNAESTTAHGASSSNADALLSFSKGLKTLKLSVFGIDNKRAILSGGLRPSLSEMAELVNESSATYHEVFDAYESLIEKAEPLEAKVNPELEQAILNAYPDALEREVVQAYPEAVEEQFVAIAPDVFKSIEKQLIDRREKINRAKFLTQIKLLRQQQRTIHSAFNQLSIKQRQQILASVLNQFGSEQRTLIIDESLSKLSNEQRYAVINLVLNNLALTNADRSVYDNYQTYKAIKKVLNQLPASIKESFAILARRAQAKAQKSSNDLNQFREEVELWFDRSMDRASGVYRRNAKGVAILIGLVLASSTNSDAFYIVNRLSNDENLRKVVTDRAVEIRSNFNPSTADNEAQLAALKQQTDNALKDLAMPIGWKPENLVRQFDCQAENAGSPACTPFANLKGSMNISTIARMIAARPIDFLKLLIGWLVSGIAISMGAPFWFDLLGKVMNVRNSGKKPAPQTDTTTKAK